MTKNATYCDKHVSSRKCIFFVVIASMKAGSAPRLNGLPLAFCQKFWNVLKPVIMLMFHEFYIWTFDMSMINFRVITLIPKVVGATDI